jgi:hypothetical protein
MTQDNAITTTIKQEISRDEDIQRLSQRKGKVGQGYHNRNNHNHKNNDKYIDHINQKDKTNKGKKSTKKTSRR